jgi:fructosamine-3-kinase
VFFKQRPGSTAQAYAYEAAGLDWLREGQGEFDGCPIPWVRDVGPDHLALDFVSTVSPNSQAAAAFGRQLAGTHALGAEAFGALPPGIPQGFIADLPLPVGTWETFGSFYAQARVRPLAQLAHSKGAVANSHVAVFAELAEALEAEDSRLLGSPERIARLHGDLWSGNVLWRRRDCVLIDPSAHGGHRESDLAMLALFGLPRLDEVVEAYDAQWPLADGWRDRVSLHQVYPLLVHAILFGGSYGSAASTAASTALATVCS